MSLSNRLNKLEGAAATLPRNGAYLLDQSTRLRPEDHGDWLRSLTDKELTMLIRAMGGDPEERQMEHLTDEELQAIINAGKKG